MKKCVHCGAENNAEYKYCKLCGAELPCVDQKVYRDGSYSEEQADVEFSTESEDISISEISEFVGKNSRDIIPKFVEMQRGKRKFGFCLPAFLLGLFFGLPGVSLWFLFRKMIRPAVIFMTISLALSAISLAFTFSVQVQYYSGLIMAIRYFNKTVSTNPSEALGWLSNYLNELTAWISGATKSTMPFFLQFTNSFLAPLAAPIAISFFSIYIYKDYSLKRISQIKRNSTTRDAYSQDLRKNGGTSAANVVFGAIIYFVASSIVSLIPLISVLAA